MAAKCGDNVLSFERRKYLGGSATNPDAHYLLSACRDRLLDGVSAAFGDKLSSARDHLFELADGATRLEMQTLYIAAQRAINNRGREVLQSFRNVFVRSFDASVASLRGKAPKPESEDDFELSLLVDSEFEKDLAVGKLSSRALYNCSQQLTALERRIATTLDVEQIPQDSNPLFPRALYASFLEATAEVDLDQQIGITLLHEMDRQVRDRLPALYSDLNQFLVDRGVLPQIPVRIERKPGNIPPRKQEDRRPTEKTAEDVAVDEISGSDIFSRLVSRFQPGHTRGASNDYAAQGYKAAPSQGQFIESLTSIQREGNYRWTLPGVDTEHCDQGTTEILQRIRGAPIMRHASANDAVTIDIVATLFDYVLSHPDISRALRAEIGRLQVPVLKVALMDKRFFADGQHPVRHLLDLMASSSLGWSEEQAPRFFAKVKSIVDEIVQGFDKDLGVIASQPGKLEAFVAEEDECAWKNARLMVRELQRHEWAEEAQSAASAEVDHRLNNSQLPPAIRDFLTKLWRLTLVLAYARNGEESDDWRNAIQTMDDLAWSVNPKPDPLERKKFFTLLPGLLQRLHEGIQTLKLARSYEDRFFSRLARIHAQAVHPDSTFGENPIEANETEVVSAETGSALEESIKAELDVDSPPLVAEMEEEPPAEALSVPPEDAGTRETVEADAPSRPAPPQTDGEGQIGLLERLRLGTWVEFRSDRGTRTTYRLNWISGTGKVFLFADRQGNDALTVSGTRLSERLRKSTARVLSGERLTSRAIAAMMKPAKG